jgi:hypothetical protein
MSILYWSDYINQNKYQQEKENILNAKEQDLKNRESAVVDKEICFRELTKLKTIQTSVLDILKSYNLPIEESKLKNLN